jgi:hypothetical protein
MLAAIAAGLGPATPALTTKDLAAVQKRLNAPPSALAGGIPPNVPWSVHLEKR